MFSNFGFTLGLCTTFVTWATKASSQVECFTPNKVLEVQLNGTNEW